MKCTPDRFRGLVASAREDAVPENILIFSDGTGQAGGLTPDENVSNIYKLFRATHCGPGILLDIDPSEQLTFYDPGLGSQPESGVFGAERAYRWLHNLVSQATGLGITMNIVDCYAAILRMWQPGDRVFLFGFSRGAYTVRCVAAVLSLCGVPTTIADGRDFALPGPWVYPKDCKGSRQESLPARKLAKGLCLCRAKKSARPSVPTEISVRCKRSAQRQSIFHRGIRYCRRTRQLFVLCSPYCSCRRNTRPESAISASSFCSRFFRRSYGRWVLHLSLALFGTQ